MKVLLITAFMGVGVCLVLDGFHRTQVFRGQRDLNLLELKSSPYGEIVGAALQGPVSMNYHGGIGHQHVGEGQGCETCGVSHGGSGVKRSVVTQLKFDLRGLESGIRQNNLPGVRGAEVLKYEKGKVRELVKLAYEMDPTNYGNFSMYSDSVMDQSGFAGLYDVVRKTLNACDGRDYDPSDPLAAAVAAESIMVYRAVEIESRGGENAYLVDDYRLFEQKVNRFKGSFERAIDDGRLANFSQKKIDEILAVFKRLSWTLKAYGEKVKERSH
ncbi:MAG: hypothetical protein ABGY95_09160 [Rubritalea sp.]|uniref:hypothetical protein n=1 Tax=Rubritalea sp. TaxID=2109375 RepID=UPI003242DC4A